MVTLNIGEPLPLGGPRMHRFPTFALCGLCLLAVSSARADSGGKTQNGVKTTPASPAASAKAIAVEPPVIAPGQTVTFRWYFTGNKVTVSGGRFGKGAVVTGRTSLT